MITLTHKKKTREFPRVHGSWETPSSVKAYSLFYFSTIILLNVLQCINTYPRPTSLLYQDSNPYYSYIDDLA